MLCEPVMEEAAMISVTRMEPEVTSLTRLANTPRERPRT